MNKPSLIFSALSHLLLYPDDVMRQQLSEVRDILREERRLSEATRRALLAFAEDLQQGDGWDVQEMYVNLFDRTRSLSLHIFEHVHGESRDRGQAMVDLINLYQEHGLVLQAENRELPGYVPLFLEFLSTLETDAAHDLLKEPLHVLQAIGARLRQRDSAYGLIFSALEELAGVRSLIATENDEEQDIDEAWQDAEVRFLDAATPSCRPQTATAMRGE